MGGFAGDIPSVWEQPLLVRFVEALADFARVIMIDKRGTDCPTVREVPTLETRMDDLRAVMDDVDSRARSRDSRRALASRRCSAATHPERVAGPVLFDPTAKGPGSDDYPVGVTRTSGAHG